MLQLVLCSSQEAEVHPPRGLALMLSKEAQRALISLESIISRIIETKFKGKRFKIKLNVIQSYVPIGDADEEIQELLSQKLQDCGATKEQRDEHPWETRMSRLKEPTQVMNRLQVNLGLDK